MRRRTVHVAAAAGAVVAGTAVAWSIGSSRGPEVPTLQLQAQPLRVRVTAEGYLTAVVSTPLTAPVSIRRPMKVAWLLPDGSPVRAGDAVVRFDSTDLEQELENGLSDRRSAELRISSARAERQAALEKLDRDADIARRELENAKEFGIRDTAIYSRLEIVEATIDTELAEAKADHAEASKSIRDDLAEADLELLSIQHQRADLSIHQAEQGLDALAVVAPHDGIVVFERNWRGEPVRVGETAWPGMPLARLPDLSKMQAEVYVLEADAGGLLPGQSATVTLEAHPEVQVAATVEAVDPVAQPRIRGVPVQFFRTVLALEHTDAATMKPGTRVHAEIVLADLDAAITVPRQAVGEVDGATVVWRAEGHGFEVAPVTLGIATAGRVVVAEGLDSGDRIAARNPDRADDRKPASDETSSTVGAIGGAG